MITIRLAKESDIEELLLVNPLLSKKLIMDRLETQRKKDADYLVLDDGKKLLGQVLLKWQGKPTHPDYPDIENIYVRGSERGKGYGKILIEECERKAKTRGCKKIGLAVNHEPNCPEQKLYLKLGYQHDGRKEYSLKIYEEVTDVVIDMEKDL